MMDMVYVGPERLIGEVVGLRGDDIVVQVYEDTAGIMPGHPVEGTGAPMSLKLGPGLIGNIFDGIARPLRTIEKRTGCYLARGVNIPSLDAEKVWKITPRTAVGQTLSPGQVYAECRETNAIRHRVMTPPGVSGRVVYVRKAGDCRVNDTVVKLETPDDVSVKLTLAQEWPIRTPRPVGRRIPVSMPLVTGQRVIDTLFPIAKGGCAAIPGPFGAGKTITQHQLAKWSDADIIIYLGCGERGNEMTQVLEEFGALIDPKSGRPLMERTVLIANTSNMPVAAREASVYTGMTIAEYYRDMGYHVAIMADSTSRWAEALREIAGRLEEMPAEEGFPAYLPSRLAEFYERAGYVSALGDREGSITVVGAVSPQGGDFSEPVTQNTKRFVRCFWALDRQLAYARHFPAINWLSSYSEYLDDLAPWYEARLGRAFGENRARLARLLQEESQLNEIVKLIGADILPEGQKLVIEAARVARLGFLQQNAYHGTDTYMPLKKQAAMLDVVLTLIDEGKKLVDLGIPLGQLTATGIFDRLIRMKYELSDDKGDRLSRYKKDIRDCVARVLADHQ